MYLYKTLLAAMALLCLAAAMSAAAKETPAGDAKPKLKVIDVADAFGNPQDHAGKVGLEGVVIKIEGKEPSFEIHTPNPPGSCEEECCAPKRLTVHVPKDAFKGKLPKVKDKLVVVGELKPLTVGFEFTVSEVRKGGKAILVKKT